MHITRKQFGIAMLFGAAALVFGKLFGSIFGLFREGAETGKRSNGFRARYWSGGKRLAG